jgi:hypothetical protein
VNEFGKSRWKGLIDYEKSSSGAESREILYYSKIVRCIFTKDADLRCLREFSYLY